MKILSVVGARPQFIKAAMLSHAWLEVDGCDEILVHTGQHYDSAMSDVFFAEMDIPEPKYHLGVGSGLHGAQTGKMLEEIEQVLLKEKPDWMVVYGDTNSTLAAALAASKLHVPIAHVEAGLRSFNRNMPEEINRLVTDQLSTIRFTPTVEATNHLMREGYPPDSIFQVGDVMQDAVQYFRGVKPNKSLVDNFGIEGPFALATIHRAENTDNDARLRAIISGLEEVHQEIPVVFPMHPRTQKELKKKKLCPQFHIGEPVGYLEMLHLEKTATVIITDSGGVQKEAFFQKTPCVTARTETEWVELVEHGWNQLADPTDSKSIPNCVQNILNQDLPQDVEHLYGNGRSATLMTRAILNFSK